ncbi:MAG: hypothetical protein FWC33_02805 [Candidatus Bathyarchaeota archaeon]|nr:hypothetical protein [Candidatus Termiticorpusculum sp.]
MSLLIKMYHCHNCGNRFTRPDYWTVENPQGYPIKIPYCPDCVSQNIEQAEYT